MSASVDSVRPFEELLVGSRERIPLGLYLLFRGVRPSCEGAFPVLRALCLNFPLASGRFRVGQAWAWWSDLAGGLASPKEAAPLSPAVRGGGWVAVGAFFFKGCPHLSRWAYLSRRLIGEPGGCPPPLLRADTAYPEGTAEAILFKYNQALSGSARQSGQEARKPSHINLKRGDKGGE